MNQIYNWNSFRTSGEMAPCVALDIFLFLWHLLPNDSDLLLFLILRTLRELHSFRSTIYDRALIQSKLSMNPMSRNVFPSLWRLLSFWIASIATFHHSNIHLFLFYFISGVFRGGHEVLLRAKLALAEGVTMQLTVRTTNAEIAELVTSAIGW